MAYQEFYRPPEWHEANNRDCQWAMGGNRCTCKEPDQPVQVELSERTRAACSLMSLKDLIRFVQACLPRATLDIKRLTWEGLYDPRRDLGE